MKEENGSHEELEQLLLALLDGEWDTEKKERLDELLRGSAAARTHYRESMALHAMLEVEFGGSPCLNHDALATGQQSVSLGAARAGAANSPLDDSTKAIPRRARWRLLVGWAALVAVAASLGVWALSLRDAARTARWLDAVRTVR